MGLKFYVGEMQTQAAEAARMSNEANLAIAQLQDSISHFLSAPLSGKAYDSAKSYFSVVYTPLCRSALMTGEAMQQAHKRLVTEYQSSVSGIDTDEDQIQSQIEQLEQLKRNLEHQMQVSKNFQPSLERRYMNACDSISKKREKLEKFHAYNARSSSFFAEYEASQQEFSRGLAQVNGCKAWNSASGSFDISKLDMTWATSINKRWEAREQQLEALKKKVVKDAIAKLDGYEIRRVKNGNKIDWIILKNGKILNSKNNSELYSVLELYGDLLPKGSYTQMVVKKGIVDPTIALPGVGGAANIKNVVKGIGTIIISTGILTLLNDAPSVSFSDSNADEVDIEIPKDVQRKIKKLSPEQKKALDEALDKLSKGDKTGLNDHALKGDRKGERAFDIRGKGTGNNRGGIRGTYEKDGPGKIKLKDVFKGHKY
ncbi:T7SS effector LXG polymorphic toxin [Candidatus Enterococcus mansonii]|uniref:LXG domain-containing protein n=1 Tax=Candidatus Enterococcus mansonii TaxID=1834181 RepID=A0A242CEA0_9ENTE|nr:T7SS effector LXG polymorphic toxin [Enterococcus sp. 4G2_DIV0659]OTO08536.1 hypothetical protein A5880_001536 [Enterococcus sp. 4G2_DIV0659]